MIKVSEIHPDRELQEFLQGRITVGTPNGGMDEVTVYSDGDRPTNELPADFLQIWLNGDFESVGMDTPYAAGNIMVCIYCKLNDNGTVKKNRVDRILSQFDELVEKRATEHYFFQYETDRFITPTTPDQTSGYSITTLNIRWSTTSGINN